MADAESVVINGGNDVTRYRANGTVASVTHYDFPSDTYSRIVTRGSAAKQASGWRPPTGYDMYRSTMTRPYGKATYFQGLARYDTDGHEPHGTYQGDEPSFPSALKQQAEVDALTNLKGQRVNLAQAFGERDQLANLVGDTAGRIARAYRATRKGNFKKAANELGANWRKSTRNWLELQYAWKPLLGDIHGATLELQGRPPLDWLTTVKGVKSRRWTVVQENKAMGWIPMRIERKYFQGAFVRLDYHPTNEFMSLLTSLGLTNPLALAWELMPYSFVVDWLWPVGDWLSVLDATAGFSFRGGSYSRITKTVLKSDPLILSVPGQITTRNTMRGGRGRLVHLVRTPYPSSPLPRPPGLKNPVSLGHMANGLSLLAEAFGKRR